jgi:hypothetical protein
MQVRIISNDSEYSRSIARPNHTRLDICCFRKEKELVLAIVNDDEIHVEEIAFSVDELQVLMDHLSDPEVQAILGAGNDPSF